MTTVTLSSRNQMVIPKEIRDAVDIPPEKKFHICVENGEIRLIPVRSLKNLKGVFKGLKVDFSEIREKKERNFSQYL
jgi:AbrB family looped-hinge helix DNA binding protein